MPVMDNVPAALRWASSPATTGLTEHMASFNKMVSYCCRYDCTVYPTHPSPSPSPSPQNRNNCEVWSRSWLEPLPFPWMPVVSVEEPTGAHCGELCECSCPPPLCAGAIHFSWGHTMESMCIGYMVDYFKEPVVNLLEL